MAAAVMAQPATDRLMIDVAVKDLRAGAERLVTYSLDDRIRVIDQCIVAVGDVSREWVRRACAAKRIDADGPASAEEILAGPVGVVRYLQLLKATLHDIQRDGTPRLPGRTEHANGRYRVPIFPTQQLFDRLLFKPFRVESWLRPGVAVDNLFGDQVQQLSGRGVPTVVAVLGAGNVTSIPATDALTKILQQNQAVMLKMNPVNDYLGPLLEQAFAPLVDEGFLRIIFGSADVGQYVVEHSGTDAVHITGSNITHDMIVWGADFNDQQHRRETNQPLLNKPITSELGNVTPWIVVPGDYSPAQLRFQAENLVASIANNASFNCVATKMVVTARNWPDRERFLDLVETILAGVPRRFAYYPGAEQRFTEYAGQNPPDGHGGYLPWTMLRSTDVEQSPRLFQRESFVCVTAETTLSAETPEAFLEQAVDFVNDRLWGNLAAALTVPQKFPRQKLDQAIAKLRYGTIGINQWPGVSFGLMSPAWGAYPGGQLQDVQSGIGEVHNTYLLDQVEKVVLQSPLTLTPKPVWFSTHRCPQHVAWRLLDLYLHPRWTRLPSLLYHAVRG